MLKVIQCFGKPTNILTLKVATEIFAETLGNFQHSTHLVPESQRFAVHNVISSYSTLK
jgi:hypothetical protein